MCMRCNQSINLSMLSTFMSHKFYILSQSHDKDLKGSELHKRCCSKSMGTCMRDISHISDRSSSNNLLSSSNTNKSADRNIGYKQSSSCNSFQFIIRKQNQSDKIHRTISRSYTSYIMGCRQGTSHLEHSSDQDMELYIYH